MKYNTHLKYLGLSRNGIGPEGALLIAELITHNSSLKDLNLKDNSLGSSVVQIFQSLEKNTTLSSLELSYNQIGTEGFIGISQYLTNLSIKSLNLLNITPIVKLDGFKHLFKSLKHNTTLKSLILNGRELQIVKGGQFIDKYMIKNSTLSNLDMLEIRTHFTNIQSFPDVEHIRLKYLLDNQSLTSLNIDCNHFGTENVLELLKALTYNTTLRKLSII
uniref:Uncharacterized protein n=1 Tax=Arcella intermedia TaxID=1963864 RepID=A0A6B2LHA6_9EUKA